MSKNLFLHYTKLILLSFIILFMTLPAHATTMQIKGGYSDLSSNGTSIASGFMGSFEYLFNRYAGITGQFEGYTTAWGTTLTAHYNLYSAYLTLHSDIQTEDSPNAYMNDFVNIYFQLGYTSAQSSGTFGGTTWTSSVGGFAYGIGLDILPKSNFGGFVGYKGASFSQNGFSFPMSGLIAGVEMRF